MILTLCLLALFSMVGLVMSKNNHVARNLFMIEFFNLWLFLYLIIVVKLTKDQFTSLMLANVVIAIYTLYLIKKQLD